MSQWALFQAQLSVAGKVAAGAMNQAVGSLQGQVSQVDLASTQTKLSKGFMNITQTVRERAGNVEDITELPQGEFKYIPSFKMFSKKMFDI